MKTLFFLLALATAALTPSCTNTSVSTDTGPLVSVSVTYATAKLAAKRPALAHDLNAVSTALDQLADGVLNRETVTALLASHLLLADAEAKALMALISGYFPAGDAALPVNTKLSTLAHSVASAIRFGLPATK